MKRPFLDYYKYIRSKDWIDKKQHWINLFGNICVCGNIGDNLHHRHYKNLGTEPPHQLILLCKKCHMVVHGLPNEFTTNKTQLKFNLRKLLRFYRKRHQPGGVSAQSSRL